MFGKKKTPPAKDKKNSAKVDVPRNAPLTAFEKSRIVWYERYGTAVVDKNRYFVLAVASTVAMAALGLGLTALLPLKEVRPYVITTNGETGEVKTDQASAQGYTPTEAVKKWWIRRFVEMMFTLDRYETKKNLQDIFTWISGNKAQEEFRAFLEKERPFEKLKQDINTTRTVEMKSINFLQDGAAVARFYTEERSSLKAGAERKAIMMTLHYGYSAPTREEQIQKNPLGLFFTHFTIVEEIQ